MAIRTKSLASAAAVAASILVITGCSATPAEPSGPVEIEYLGWVVGLEDSIKVWNEENPDIQVKLTTTTGSVAANPLIRSGVQAGNAACLAQMAYSSIPNFVADDLLEPVTDQAAEYEDEYIPWTWSSASPGGETYGIPQDTGPMVMYYNQTEFEKYGLEIPTTWDEYAEAAQKVHAADPSVTLGFFGVDDPGNYAGLVAQAGGRWTTIDGDEWKVGIDDAGSTKVAEYWQDLISSGAVVATPRFDAGIYPLFDQGKILTMIGASWNYASFPANLPNQSGQWRIAPMPNWGSDVSANSGGSASVVVKGCKYPEQAVKFANWLNSSEESLKFLSDPTLGGLYPAATKALDYDIVNTGVEYYGDQNVYEEFAKSSALVDTSWQYGPTWESTYTEYADGFAAVATGSKTLLEVAQETQEATLKDMTDRGIAASAAE